MLTHLYRDQEMLLVRPAAEEVEQNEDQRHKHADEAQRHEELRDDHESCNEWNSVNSSTHATNSLITHVESRILESRHSQS